MRFDCDIDAFKFRRAMDEAFGEAHTLLRTSPPCVGFSRPLSIRQLARANPATLQILRVHRLRERAKALFPDAESLQEKWVQTRLRMRQIGCRRPRVRIGCQKDITFPRTLRAAGIQGGLS